DESGVTQIHRVEQSLVERDHDRKLDQHRQASTERVNVITLIQVDHLTVEPLGVVLELLADLRDLGLQALHLHHGTLTADRDRQGGQLHHDSQQDNRDAIVRKNAIQQL